jgi:uncharacterized protein (DUF2147 family)
MRHPASIFILLALAGAARPQAATPIEGLWKNPIGSAIIEITPCGSAFCGKVVWASARGRREVSKNAPNVVGTTVLTDVRPVHGKWSGSLYIPDDDIHVSAHLQPIAKGQMNLTGCALWGLFCRTQIWTRVDSLPSRDG